MSPIKTKKRARTSPLEFKKDARRAKKKKGSVIKEQAHLQPQIDSYFSFANVQRVAQELKVVSNDLLSLPLSPTPRDFVASPSDPVTQDQQEKENGEKDSYSEADSEVEGEQSLPGAALSQRNFIKQLSETCLISAHTLLLILERLGGIREQVHSVSQNIAQIDAWCKRVGTSGNSIPPPPQETPSSNCNSPGR